LADARAAFLRSYGPAASGNRFTKVKIDVSADVVLRHYFTAHAKKIESWFNIIAPKGGCLKKLREELRILSGKEWRKILPA
jgi:hypothetical protein